MRTRAQRSLTKKGPLKSLCQTNRISAVISVFVTDSVSQAFRHPCLISWPGSDDVAPATAARAPILAAVVDGVMGAGVGGWGVGGGGWGWGRGEGEGLLVVHF